MIDVKNRALGLSAALAIALALSACAVYEPAPAYPVYGYAPGYYAPSPSVYFRYDSGPRRRHHHHRHRHWRG